MAGMTTSPQLRESPETTKFQSPDGTGGLATGWGRCRGPAQLTANNKIAGSHRLVIFTCASYESSFFGRRHKSAKADQRTAGSFTVIAENGRRNQSQVALRGPGEIRTEPLVAAPGRCFPVSEEWDPLRALALSCLFLAERWSGDVEVGNSPYL
jgi:hypothetical protein